MKLSRRHLLEAAACAALPTLLLPRRAAAATRAFGQAEHVLILFAKGGFRSHCTFNAVGQSRHDPFGVQPAQPGTEWTLGAACGSEDVTSSRGVIPAMAKISKDIAVLACVDHLPGGQAVDVDHRTAVNRIATGDPSGTTGLLSRIGKHHPRYRDGFSVSAFPPVEIGPTEFGLGTGDYAGTRPLSVVSAANNFSAQASVGRGWKIGARRDLDARFRDRHSRAYRARISNYLAAKGLATTLGDVLASPTLDVLGKPAASADGFSNGELIEIFGALDLATLGDTQNTPSWGPDVAMALRFLSLGAPACVVTRDIYDLHDNERSNYAPRTRDLSRQLAGLNYVLRRMPHPRGGNYWDKTLVAVVSEFSRNNTEASGFNSGNGSDHVGEGTGPTRNQAIAVMGGVVTVPGKRLGATDAELNAQDLVFSSRSLLSTFLDVLGIDPLPVLGEAGISELFV